MSRRLVGELIEDRSQAGLPILRGRSPGGTPLFGVPGRPDEQGRRSWLLYAVEAQSIAGAPGLAPPSPGYSLDPALFLSEWVRL
jgi:hypothetical protein